MAGLLGKAIAEIGYISSVLHVQRRQTRKGTLTSRTDGSARSNAGSGLAAGSAVDTVVGKLVSTAALVDAALGRAYIYICEIKRH